MHNHWLFLGNVVVHWVGSMSGAVSFVLAIVEYVRNKKLEGIAFTLVAILFFFVACDAAWQDEHLNAERLKDEKKSAVVQSNFWEAQFYREQDQLESVNGVLAKNLGALSATQTTQNETQKSLTQLSEKIFDVGKPPKQKSLFWRSGQKI
jgi:hypothetical protein